MGSSDKAGTNGTGQRNWKSGRSSISWSGGPSDSMRAAIGRITDNGAAVLFSRTLDGGALSIQVLAGDERSKEYITDAGDIVACLNWLGETNG